METTTEEASESADLIAYAREPVNRTRHHEIWVIGSDGRGDRRLVESEIDLNHPDWSPDGQRLAAVGIVSDDTWSIHNIEADGSSVQRLTWQPGVWDVEPAWSPDGTLIAFSRIDPSREYRSELWVMSADGGNPRWIGQEGFGARWSADGKHLVFATAFRGSSGIATCRIDGSGIRHLSEPTHNETNPSWSPDGSKILFISDEDGDRDLYLMDADGQNRRRLTDNHVPEFVARWSPDGRKIAFDSGLSRVYHWQVFVVDIDGSGLEQVTSTPDSVAAVNPSWRPRNSVGGPHPSSRQNPATVGWPLTLSTPAMGQ